MERKYRLDKIQIPCTKLIEEIDEILKDLPIDYGWLLQRRALEIEPVRDLTIEEVENIKEKVKQLLDDNEECKFIIKEPYNITPILIKKRNNQAVEEPLTILYLPKDRKSLKKYLKEYLDLLEEGLI